MKTPSLKNLFLGTQDDQLPAIYSSEENLSYGELKDRVDKTVRTFIDLDIAENDHIAILGNNEPEFISIVIALWHLGAVPVPLNTRLLNKELNELILRSDCKAILVSKNHDGKKFKFPVESVTYPFSTTSKGILENDFQPQFTSTAVIIFTSGSSSAPKAVELSFKSLFESAKIGNKILRQTSEDRWLASLPFYHVSGFSIIIRSLLFGTSIILPESNSVEDIVTAIDMFNPTFCSIVPTQLSRLINYDVHEKEQIRHLLVGGGFSNDKLILDALKLGWNVTKVYGLTETSAFVAAITGDVVLYKPTSVGKALHPNVIKILNDKGIDVIEYELGEIAIFTPAIMKGYYKNEVEAKQKFKNDYYLSGDLGYLDHEGYLYLEARRTDLIVTGGENVNSIEIENALLVHPDVDEAAVIPLANEEWGQVVTAVVVLKNNKNNLSVEELNRFLRNELADFKLPRKLFIEKSLPKSDLGKIEKEKLIEHYKFKSL